MMECEERKRAKKYKLDDIYFFAWQVKTNSLEWNIQVVIISLLSYLMLIFCVYNL